MAITTGLRPSSTFTGVGVPLQHRVHKFAHLRDERVHVALEEEVQRFLGDHAVGIAVHTGVGGVVGRRRHAAGTEHLHALVVPVDRFAAVVDGADGAVGELERDDGGVDIARFADGGSTITPPAAYTSTTSLPER